MYKAPALSSTPQPFEYTWLQKVGDFLMTLRGLWLLLLFNLIALFAFLFAAQGTDVLLAIIENSVAKTPWPMVWLLIALLYWSIASEFCTRFIIYLTDNSGRSLAPQRVDYRKTAQKNLARFFLFFPTFLMIAALIKALLRNRADDLPANIVTNFILFILVLIAFATLLYFLYIKKGIVRIARKYPGFARLAISRREARWVGKLYGIFNDVRIDFPKGAMPPQVDLPRNKVLPNGMKLPKEFVPYSNNPRTTDRNLDIWLFKIPLSFYSCLKRQLLILFLLSAFFILLFSFLDTSMYAQLGATALICLAFGCWQVVYVMTHFLDKIQRIIPVRFVLLVLFIVSSFVNNDHPVRKLDQSAKAPPSLHTHFNAWLNHLRAHSIPHSTKDTVYRIGPARDTIPVIFIAAEGGALRTGAFTAMTLAKLADNFPAVTNYIYCYSGVSGGTLGSNFFNALYIDHKLNGNDKTYAEQTDLFFKHDFLAAVTGKMVFGEILNYFIPRHIDRFDRAIALEKVWEEGWEDLQTSTNRMQQPFSALQDTLLPAVFINTTEAETGLQCIWSNVGLDSIVLGRQRDLYQRTHYDLRYSTAINLSTRFPLVSPGAAFSFTDTLFGKDSAQRRHFVDGGYFENTGAETLLEIMKLLHLESKPVKPYVIQFNFAEKDSIKSSSIRKFSEPMEIIGAIYNTRSGRSRLSQEYLRRYVKSLNGEFISLNLQISSKKFPMNWVLSGTAMKRLDTAAEELVNPHFGSEDFVDKNELHKLFVYNTGK